MIIKLLVAFGVLTVVALMTLAVLRSRDDGKVDGVWQSLEAPSTHQVFTEDMVSDLPAPARRYLLHAIRPGTPLASSVRLEMHGTMRLKPEQEWMPMKARQIIAPPKGFVWRAEVGDGLMRFSGGDHYSNGSGRVRFWLWGVIPLVNQEGPDVSRAAAMATFLSAARYRKNAHLADIRSHLRWASAGASARIATSSSFGRG